MNVNVNKRCLAPSCAQGINSCNTDGFDYAHGFGKVPDTHQMSYCVFIDDERKEYRFRILKLLVQRTWKTQQAVFL